MDKAQKDWLLDTFFKNDNFPGWKNIATELIETGNCLTSKQGENIWIGGIGNFIESKPYNGGIDIIELTFNLKEFISENNAFFMEYYNEAVISANEKAQVATDYANSITNLTFL